MKIDDVHCELYPLSVCCNQGFLRNKKINVIGSVTILFFLKSSITQGCPLFHFSTEIRKL